MNSSATTRPPVGDDFAQNYLIEHLRRSETRLRAALRAIDPAADCQVLPAADLGIPYDVLRLGGGFATGCLVDWACSIPVVPIDITMNIDTTSIFWLDGDPGAGVAKISIDRLHKRIEEESSYEWNFNRSNHFIALCRRASDQRVGLILHSNEKEFKDQYNGLAPTVGNWYEDAIQVHGDGAPVRLLVGDKADLFVGMAHMLEDFNVIRHEFVATMLLGGMARVVEEQHRQHYYMPTDSSAAIGCYVCEPGDQVLVFSALGQPITVFEAQVGGANAVTFIHDGPTRLIVPHGWGMTSIGPLQIAIDDRSISMNGRTFDLKPGASLLEHPDVIPRTFSAGNGEFFERISQHTPGRVVDQLSQVWSYSRHGFIEHEG